MRKLAVPIALRNVGGLDTNTMTRTTRALRADDPVEHYILSKLVENRARIDRLRMDVESAVGDVDCSDIVSELEYLKADIELSLVEIEADIEDAPSSEEILAQEAEAVLA
ncbi:MAG: hypothetical protein AB7S97_06425 [Thermoplasmata archaeon]